MEGTRNDVLHSCTRCRMRQQRCLCALAPRLTISTRVIVVMHSKEWRRTTNTGHFARLAIQGGEVRVHGSPRFALNSEGVEVSRSTLVLHPGHGAVPLTSAYAVQLPRPLTLLVPDGNWNQADHMMRRVPMLREARPVRLVEQASRLSRLRHNPRAERTSTFEAIAQALAILEGPDVAEAMLAFFQEVLKRLPRNSRRHSAN